MYTVYKHTSPSGKVYIGITALTPQKRWQNGNGYKDCTLFNMCIKKYGWENISHEIIATDLTEKQACQMEKELVAKYKEKGISYNCSIGGELTAKGCKRTKEFREKLSRANKGKHLTKETKRKLSESHKGKRYPVTEAVIMGRLKTKEKLQGKPFSESHKAKLSEAKKGKRLGAENPSSKKIMCVTNGVVYSAVKEAARILNLDASSICKVCKGKLKHYKGYVFQYVSDV